jgi:hypothetical protein
MEKLKQIETWITILLSLGLIAQAAVNSWIIPLKNQTELLNSQIKIMQAEFNKYPSCQVQINGLEKNMDDIKKDISELRSDIKELIKYSNVSGGSYAN